MANLKEEYAKYFGVENLLAQELVNNYNNESAQKQMDYQTYMSNTAHTREVADLLNAGLNPVLSANAGAPAMPGAYSSVDSVGISAGIQRKMQAADLANQRIMNKYAADMSAATGRYAARVGAAATMAAASMSANASMYNADVSANAMLTNNREQRAWDSMHPSNPYQAGGSLLELIGIRNGNSYNPGSSSAK